MIHELLGSDPLTGWTMPQLKKRLGASKYEVLAQIERERRRGFPICQTRHVWERYYLADNKKHFETFVKHYRADTRRAVRSLDYLEAILTNWKGTKIT